MTSLSESAGLSPVLQRALHSKGYDTLTEVQGAMLDPALADQDLLVSAQTGSGKTVAFGLALGPNLLSEDGSLPEGKRPAALVVAPTRELAMQVARELTWLYADANVRIATCVGGMDMRAERQALGRGAHIIVGTPGRLVDHLCRKALKLNDLRAVVLDEADEMLNLGFREELETILNACPDDRRTLMFSATVGGGIAKLAARYQNEALRVSIRGPERQHDDIAYQAMMVAQHDSEKAIINTLRFHEAENAIVFCSTRAAVARLTSRLANRGFAVVSLSGELSQHERSNALQAMRDGRANVCVATDVAARGIDLPGLELVVHADLPKNREGLLHRSGRTGRAGQKGTSVLVVPPKARRAVERLLREAEVKARFTTPPTADEVRAQDNQRLLTDPLVTEDTAPTELSRSLAEAYSAEHLASVIVRMHQTQRSAPEEISEIVEREPRREKPARQEIENSVWVTLSVGRQNRAEPRWLLPMLCKAGSLKKQAIGAIRIQEDRTFVELDAEGASDFVAAAQGGLRLEDGIEAHLAEGPPQTEARRGQPQADKQRRPSKTQRRDKLARRPKNAATNMKTKRPNARKKKQG